MVSMHQQDLLWNRLPEMERYPWHVTSRDACRFLESTVDDDGKVAFPYLLKHCDCCPENTAVNRADEVWNSAKLFYPNFSCHEAFEWLLPKLLDQYQEQLAASSTPEELIGVVADFTQMFILIHPFVDGNGRTFRLFADYVLMLYGLAPAVFDVFKPVPCTREQWRQIFSKAQWDGEVLNRRLPLP